MTTEWIEISFPTDDPEAFIEALERCILGDFGPGSVHATLDDLVDYAQQTPSFRGRLLLTCDELFANEWFAPDANLRRERKILIGLLPIIRRVPLVDVVDSLRDWFDRHAERLLEEDLGGPSLGSAILSAILAIEGERTPEIQIWWDRYAGSDAWSSKIKEIERYTIRSK